MDNCALNYIVQNTPAVVENVFTDLLWYGKNAASTIQNAVNHAVEYHYCDTGLFRASINAALRAALQSEKDFRAFVNERRKLICRPEARNAAEYIGIMWEVSGSLSDVYIYLRRNIMEV